MTVNYKPSPIYPILQSLQPLLSNSAPMLSLLESFLPPEQALLIALMLASIPLSYVLTRLRNKHLTLVYSIVVSICLQWTIYSAEKHFLWAQQQVVYLLLKFAPRKQVGRTVMIESFIFLAIVQVRRMFISYGVNGIDITGILMMQTFLYIGLAYNYQNGLKSPEQLSQSAERRKVKELPDYLTYIGYVSFVPACLVGPVFEFRDFEDYINRRGDYENMPSTFKPAFRQLLITLFTISVYLSLSSFKLEQVYAPEFAQYSYGYKMLVIIGAITAIEFKYITAWSLGMISVHISGFSYSKTRQAFDKIQTTKMKEFFLEPSLKVKIECWNMSVQAALKKYIYEQQFDSKAAYPDEKSRKRAQATAQRNTLLTSAFWHGFYPGYLMSFFQWMIFLRMTQELFRLRNQSPRVDRLWTKYHFGVVQNLVSHFVFLYFGVYFHVMTLDRIKFVLFSTYGIPFFVLYALYFVIYESEALSRKAKKKQAEKKSADNDPISVKQQ